MSLGLPAAILPPQEEGLSKGHNRGKHCWELERNLGLMISALGVYRHVMNYPKTKLVKATCIMHYFLTVAVGQEHRAA